MIKKFIVCVLLLFVFPKGVFSFVNYFDPIAMVGSSAQMVGIGNIEGFTTLSTNVFGILQG